MTGPDWGLIFRLIKEKTGGMELPSISAIAFDNPDPYRILFSTIISLRTKDKVTIEASFRLFKEAPDIFSLRALPDERIAALIYPSAFYKTKASNMKKCADIIINKYDGKVPDDREELLKLPGVGRKTANLTLNLGFGINAICVDTHVHRICNRTGWVFTTSPDETEAALEKILPPEYWIPLNEALVSYGQAVCTPIGPFCSECPLSFCCKRTGVGRSR